MRARSGAFCPFYRGRRSVCKIPVISQNWRGKPLVSHETIVNLIAATTTKTGLKVACELDRSAYPSGIKVSKKEMEELNLRRDAFHGEWNYTISPRTPK
jgi:Rhodopirellula transposase DDE domain